MNEVFHRALADGSEGLMIKLLDGPGEGCACVTHAHAQQSRAVAVTACRPHATLPHCRPDTTPAASCARASARAHAHACGPACCLAPARLLLPAVQAQPVVDQAQARLRGRPGRFTRPRAHRRLARPGPQGEAADTRLPSARPGAAGHAAAAAAPTPQTLAVSTGRQPRWRLLPSAAPPTACAALMHAPPGPVVFPLSSCSIQPCYRVV